VVLELGARAKRPGGALVGESVVLDASQEKDQGMPPYERLLGDAMRGDQMLFARADSVEDAWRIVDPVIDGAEGRAPLQIYQPGTWGPVEAEQLIGDAWRNPV
jgi:glucose-6-phosphate 1-dehydrogenase